MPITDSPTFLPPWDLHVLRGQNPVFLNEFLRVGWKTDSGQDTSGSFREYAEHHDDAEMGFRPVFTYTISGDKYVGFGIEVEKSTGKITVAAGPTPNPAVLSFIVEAMLAKNTGGPNPWHFPVALLRVVIHEHIDRIWLTPRRLSIHPPTQTDDSGTHHPTDYAFTVRARFDDATAGDITYSDQLQMFPADHFLLNPSGVRRIQLPVDTSAGAIIPVAAMTSAEWGSHGADGEIEVLEPWETEQNVPQAEWIDGNPSVLDGTLKPESLPNVLLLACGFTDQTAFRTITDLMVDHLKRDRMLQPYGYLAASINYWRLMIPAQEVGVSVRCEVHPFTRDGQLFAVPVPAPAWPLPGRQWELKNLIYMAGLPVRADLNLVRDKDTNQPPPTVASIKDRDPEKLDFTLLSQKWDATMQPNPTRNVTTKVAKEWLALADRAFIDEVNNFPATSIGLPPSAREDETAFLTFHDLRGGRGELVVYALGRVTAASRGSSPPIELDDPDPDNKPAGNLWRSTRFAFDNRAFITTLSNAPFGRAQNEGIFGLHVRLSMQDPGTHKAFAGIPVAPVADRDALTLLPTTGGLAVNLAETSQVFAHELGHSCGLGDEYVEFADVFDGAETDLDEFGNLTTTAAVLNPDATIRLGQVKWNWHRIRFASVVTGPIQPASGGFEVPVQPPPFPWYVKDDIVFLRKRERGKVIKRKTDTDTSGALRVVSVNQTGDRVIVTPMAGGVLGSFDPGSILYMPVPAPSIGLYLRLIPPAAERIMQVATKGTMTGTVCNPDRQASSGGSTQVPEKSDPVGHVSSKDLPGLVGVYFGGRRSACGVLHPAGQCMMRNSYLDTSRFCPVCRYILVEQIDPNQHWRIDRDYDKQYPL